MEETKGKPRHTGKQHPNLTGRSQGKQADGKASLNKQTQDRQEVVYGRRI